MNSRIKLKAGVNLATSPTFFASLLTPLFEQIALIVSQHQPVVEKYYGRGRMLPVAAKLQEECDRQANAILAIWEDERRTARKLQETQRYKYPHLAMLSTAPQLPQPMAVAALKRPYQQLSRQNTGPNVLPIAQDEDPIDPRDIDALLTEMSQISGRWELYRRFMYGRLHVSPLASAYDISLISSTRRKQDKTRALGICLRARHRTAAPIPC